MERQTNKKQNNMGMVVALAVAIFIGLIILTIAVVSMVSDNSSSKKTEDTTLYTLSGVQSSTEESKSEYFDWSGTESSSAAVSSGVPNNVKVDDVVQAGDTVTVTTTEKSEGYNPVKEYEKLTKSGENVLSDHHNNKYIKLVADKYGADTECLVAIYSDPDTGNNFVLEFNGEKDEDGNVIKSPDTLSKVYLVDKNKEISVATGKTTGNIGVSYAEGTLCFNMIKTIVMPQYPDYFTGVEE